MATTSSLRRVILPLTPGTGEDRLLVPATVLASWFGVPLQLVVADEDQLENAQSLSTGIGLLTEAPVVVAADGGTSLAEHAHAVGPSLVVMGAADGVELARQSDQLTFIVTDPLRPRLATGPLAVEISGSSADLDALAVAATWSMALDIPIRGVCAIDDPLVEELEHAVERLVEMGVSAGIDRVRPHGLEPAVLVARTRGATALVLPAERLDEEVTERAVRAGVAILAVPPPSTSAAAPIRVDISGGRPARADTPAGAGLAAMSADECMQALQEHNVGRLGYVDQGWPTVVPVNYSTVKGDVFIRTLEGAKLSAAKRSDVVCLEIDEIDEFSRGGWSVVVHGRLEVITDPSALRMAWEHDPEPFVANERWHWLRLMPFSFSGRRVVGAADSPLPG